MTEAYQEAVRQAEDALVRWNNAQSDRRLNLINYFQFCDASDNWIAAKGLLDVRFRDLTDMHNDLMAS